MVTMLCSSQSTQLPQVRDHARGLRRHGGRNCSLGMAASVRGEGGLQRQGAHSFHLDNKEVEKGHPTPAFRSASLLVGAVLGARPSIERQNVRTALSWPLERGVLEVTQGHGARRRRRRRHGCRRPRYWAAARMVLLSCRVLLSSPHLDPPCERMCAAPSWRGARVLSRCVAGVGQVRPPA